MGIKIPHILIITLSIVLSVFFSYKMYTGNTIYLFVAGVITSASLAYYLSIIIRKFQTI